MAHLDKWLSFTTLLDVTPPVLWPLQRAYLAFVTLSIIVALVLLFLPVHTASKQRLGTLLWTNGAIGIVLFFFRYQQIPLLGMNLWRLIQEIVFVAWLLFILRFMRKQIPADRFTEKVIERRNKYLPKPKLKS
jgi:hypothetical protein